MGPIWNPFGTHLQKQYGPHMGSPNGSHIVTHMGPISVLYALLAGMYTHNGFTNHGKCCKEKIVVLNAALKLSLVILGASILTISLSKLPDEKIIKYFK